MSRIGKKPIAIPSGVTVTIGPDAVAVKGPKGQLSQALPPGIGFELADASLEARIVGKQPGLSKVSRLGAESRRERGDRCV